MWEDLEKNQEKCSKQVICGIFRNALLHIPEVFETRYSQNMVWHSESRVLL